MSTPCQIQNGLEKDKLEIDQQTPRRSLEVCNATQPTTTDAVGSNGHTSIPNTNLRTRNRGVDLPNA
jgi:hypothetical protein